MLPYALLEPGHHLFLRGGVQPYPERKPDDLRGDPVRHVHRPVRSAVAGAGSRRMQRHVMEDGMYPVPLELAQNALPIDFRRQQHVIHMRIVAAIGRHDRAPQKPRFFERIEQAVVIPPDGQAFAGNPIRFLELRPQKGRDQLAGEKR